MDPRYQAARARLEWEMIKMRWRVFVQAVREIVGKDRRP